MFMMNSTDYLFFPFQASSDLDFLMTCLLHVDDELNFYN
jgi:hypothetical protein